MAKRQSDLSPALVEVTTDSPVEVPVAFYRYTGGGVFFVIGIPARDLSVAEWAALSPVEQDLGLQTGVYLPVFAAPAEGAEE